MDGLLLDANRATLRHQRTFLDCWQGEHELPDLAVRLHSTGHWIACSHEKQKKCLCYPTRHQRLTRRVTRGQNGGNTSILMRPSNSGMKNSKKVRHSALRLKFVTCILFQKAKSGQIGVRWRISGRSTSSPGTTPKSVRTPISSQTHGALEHLQGARRRSIDRQSKRYLTQLLSTVAATESVVNTGGQRSSSVRSLQMTRICPTTPKYWPKEALQNRSTISTPSASSTRSASRHDLIRLRLRNPPD